MSRVDAHSAFCLFSLCRHSPPYVLMMGPIIPCLVSKTCLSEPVAHIPTHPSRPFWKPPLLLSAYPQPGILLWSHNKESLCISAITAHQSCVNVRVAAMAEERSRGRLTALWCLREQEPSIRERLGVARSALDSICGSVFGNIQKVTLKLVWSGNPSG